MSPTSVAFLGHGDGFSLTYIVYKRTKTEVEYVQKGHMCSTFTQPLLLFVFLHFTLYNFASSVTPLVICSNSDKIIKVDKYKGLNPLG